MTGAEMELAVLVARGIVEGGSAIYQAIVADEDPEELLERARAAGVALPVRTGPGGAWDADLDARLSRGGGDARPIGERETPAAPLPANPFGEVARSVVGCVDCGKPAALVGDLIPGDGLCRWCRDPEGTTT